MKTQWVLKKGNPLFGKELTPDKLVLALLWNRGIKTAGGVNDFIDPPLLPEISLGKTGISAKEVGKALTRIKKAIKDKEKILVFGDYDADGFCSTVLVWEALVQSGADALPFVPSREEGYGLKANKVKELRALAPNLNLVITTDNGIVEHEEIKLLQKEGVETIITDHHQPLKTLPKAVAIVHTTKLSGSGVAWFFARELKKLGALAPDLGLAALGTVTDMMDVRGVNRSLIKEGLVFLRSTSRVGLRRLFSRAGIERKPLSTYELGFIIGPRLNALGRIADPMDGLRLLCTKKELGGARLAKRAQEVNTQRQKLTAQGLLLAKKKINKKDLPALIFSSSPSFEVGLVGLIASKLKDEFYRPALVIKKGKEVSRGSARSIEGLNIIKILRSLESLFTDLGGHALAAGFELKTKNLPQLEKKLLALVEKKLKGKKLEPKVEVDLALSLTQATAEYYRAVDRLAPFGSGNKEPVFIFKNLRIVSLRKVGKTENHLKLILDDPQTPKEERVVAEAIGFNLGEWGDQLKEGSLVDLAASLTENVWQGRRKIVLKVEDLRLAN